MSDYLVKGTLVSTGEKKEVSEKFSVKTFVIETEEQYPQKVQFQASNSNIDSLDNLVEGQKIQFNFELRGKEYVKNQGEPPMYFNTLNAFNIKEQAPF